MSSGTSRAPGPIAGWQQQSRANNQQPSVSRTNQSPPAGSKAQQNYIVTSHPSNEAGSSADNLGSQNYHDHDSQAGTLHPEPRETLSNPDFQSHFHSYGNYLTPDHGSEIPFSEESGYTSPSVDDFFWGHEYNASQDLNDLGVEGPLVTNPFDNIDTSGDLQGIIPKETPNASLDPRSSTPRMSTTATVTTSTLPTSTHQNVPSAHFLHSNMSGESSKRSRALSEDHSDDDRSSRSTTNQQHSNTTRQPFPQLVKPTVFISTHSRGDSPARTTTPLRSLSKRSQSSRLSDNGETLNTDSGGFGETRASSSRLMPPDQYANDNWDDEEEGDEEEAITDRGGVAPTQRDSEIVPSLQDMDKQRELDATNANVKDWLANSEAGSPIEAEADRNAFRNRVRRERMRSRSTGARTDQHGDLNFSDKHIPGPGIMLDVEIDPLDEYTDDGSSFISSNDHTDEPVSPPADVKPLDPSSDQSYFPAAEEIPVAPEDEEPLPRQFYRRAPWQDSHRFTEATNTQEQPMTSNQAMVQFDRQAAQFETASRAATWGTRRRLSDSDVTSIVDGSKVRHLSLSHKARDRSNSILNKARGVIRRSSSSIKKSKEHLHRQHSPPHEPERINVLDHDQHSTVTSPVQQVQRTFSWERPDKPISPPPSSMGGAIMAMTRHLTAVGGGGNTASASIEPSERPKSPFFSALKRSRSNGGLPKTPKSNTPGLSDLFNRHGGPPVTKLGASPLHVRGEPAETNHVVHGASNVDNDMDDDDDEVPVKMELPIQSHNIIPNLDGFRTHARQLNPRLEPYLVERIAQDQLRRYKKLVKSKIDHTRNVQLKQNCPSGAFCGELGGKSKILPPRTSAKDANINYAQFKIGGGGDSDGEEGTFVEGVVTPALFPSGIPLPPTTHLPAEFECPLCFQVKKFQKPSDWTKHVHEDVQPFSCTFPNCPEPKSFKRKADWVRHENERHRHLEWWKCNIQECAHICYRKDNFVQHLVREHKMTEPKAKGQRPNGQRARPAARSSQNLGPDTDDFWHRVDSCRHDTQHTPKNEPCKFCGNFSSTWKKLSVHVGKHMEQIAMPVLDLAARRAITPDTIISPIDPPHRNMASMPMVDTMGLGVGLNGNHLEALSPYSASAVSGYQNSSAGQSPVPVPMTHTHSNNTSQGMYDQGIIPNTVPNMGNNLQSFSSENNVAQNYPYPSYEVAHGPGFMPMANQGNTFTQQPTTQGIPAPFPPQQIPRSQHMEPGYGSLNVDTMQASMYNTGQYYPNSAPGNAYSMSSFSNGMGHADGLHSPHHGPSAHAQSAVTSTQPGSGDYLYAQHQHGANGGHHFY